ncbi:transcription antitermination factor NusB [Marinilactibacillus psychrotolerans]|uniref:Transcription antitermination protein NusB n=2 Tax=Marinilactibacillus psychrotolerans TaxID=191770 RepID=A0A511H2P0_9LACT|nr:transcription antitermination factor NusB [Marinilactibacillus psychrotolerans]TLQ09242.1 transcription antitermination factor NusB [Marinilactibacillus psychrotolerans]SDD18585.1 NusB antitermination factor [Marinilactibacillus psychrotolerans]SJN18455.1 Transcription termination protein NusB [Marinilactibacillus psychrotolerans 42ea]GEL67785.1 N utilization substance protein B [Marinilactibacillus psychrotolerans]GEQ32136.1 transcription antitermination factor NusB [Marinilactibacillus ps
MRTVRRVIREKAFQSLFQLSTDIDCTFEEVIQFALESELDMKKEFSLEEAMKQVLPQDKNGNQIVKDALSYLSILVSGVKENEGVIDETITKHLKSWTLTRLERTNLLILRLAAYELLYQKEIDKRVVMNEAIELTKDFNDQQASKFVNGVLQSIVDTQS